MFLSLAIYSTVVIFSCLYCLVAAVPYLLSYLLPPSFRGRLIRHLILLYGHLVVRIALRPFIRVRHQDFSGGTSRPGIYVFNHRSSSDPFLVSVLNREVIQIVNGWPMRLKFYGHFARLGEYIDSTSVSYPELQALISSLVARGVSIVAFPEGTRSGGRFMNKFHSGIFHLARELRLPLYPCCVAGNEEMPTRQFVFKRRGTILVRQLPPITAEEAAKLPSAYVLKRKVHDLIRLETEKMDRELDDGKVQN